MCERESKERDETVWILIPSGIDGLCHDLSVCSVDKIALVGLILHVQYSVCKGCLLLGQKYAVLQELWQGLLLDVLKLLLPCSSGATLLQPASLQILL